MQRNALSEQEVETYFLTGEDRRKLRTLVELITAISSFIRQVFSFLAYVISVSTTEFIRLISSINFIIFILFRGIFGGGREFKMIGVCSKMHLGKSIKMHPCFREYLRIGSSKIFLKKKRFIVIRSHVVA